jgi:sarcosine oxidase
MSTNNVDVVIIGGGAMGLATAWWTASRARVVVLERFDPGHTRGASHGNERIFRYLYSDPAYVAMAQEADEGWRRLERDADRRLLHRVGNVQHGSSADLDAMVDVAHRLGVKVERLSATEAGHRWTGMRFVTDVVFQPDAGWVEAAAALDSLAGLATGAGADLHFGSHVTGIERRPGGVAVRTTDVTYRATTVVVTAGAWTKDLTGEVPMPPLLTTEEHVFFFRQARDAPSTTFIHHEDFERYGLPCPDGLYKVAEHHSGDVVTGDHRTFSTSPERVDRMTRYVSEWLPGLVPDVVRTATCLYTSTPTRDFVLDRVGPIVVGTGFSGHGFKFVPEIGRRLSALALQ